MSKSSLSIVIPTLNNEQIIEKFFHYLNNQNYPKKNIEILILDGGSKDRTIEIARNNNAKVINNPDILAEPGVNLGIKNASHNVIMILAVDNFLNDSKFISKVMQVFESDLVYAAFPKHESNNDDSIFTKYFNIFTDPFNHFVYGYAANARTFKRIYKVITSNDLYDIYDYQSSKRVPMIALAQGFTFRSGFKRDNNDFFDDCKPIIEIIKSGKNIAYIHSASVFHHTIRNYAHFLRKQRWATLNAFKKESYGINHRISNFSISQKIRIKLWPIYSVSLILPFIRCIWGVFRDKELIWLFHPIICLLSFYASSSAIIRYILNDRDFINFLRQK